MHEALHHLLVRGDVGVQEFEDQALLDNRVFHEQHGAECALADLFDELVAALDDVSRLQGRDVQLRGRRGFLGLLDDIRQRRVVDEQRLGRLLHLFRALVGRDLLRRETVVQLLHRACDCLAQGAVGAGRNGLQAHADGVGAPLVGELGQRRDRLDFDFIFRPRQHGQQGLEALLIADLADGADHRRQGLRLALQHVDEARQRLGAADFRQRVDGALADPPVRVARRFDELRHGALILGLIQDLDGGAADILILVFDQGEHGIDHARAADLAQRIGCAGTDPPIAVGDHFEQILDRLRGADDVQDFDGGAAARIRFHP